MTTSESRSDLLQLLKSKSVSRGEFILSSGAKSSYYIDCRRTTLDPRGAWLVGRVLYDLICAEETRLGVRVQAVGGLTMGADPVALSVGMTSHQERPDRPFQVFSVRKTAKAHGQGRRIEGNFKAGDLAVVIDDVVTTGESTLQAIEAVLAEGGKIAFVAVLVDRQEGGRQRIEEKGYTVVAAVTRTELLE